MTTPYTTTCESNAVTELRALVRALEETHWSSWQSTAKFDPALKSAAQWLRDYDARKPA